MDKITGARKGPYFFWVGPPGKLQAASPQALKLDRSQAIRYYRI